MVARPIALFAATAVLGFMTTAGSGTANPLVANAIDTLALDMSAQRMRVAPRGRPEPRVMQNAPRVMQSVPRVRQSAPRNVAYPARVVSPPGSVRVMSPPGSVRVVSPPGSVRVVSPPGSVSVNPNVGGSGARIVAPGPQAAPRFGKQITVPVAGSVGTQAPGPGKLKVGPGNIGPVGAAKLQAGPGLVKPATLPVVKINNKIWPIAKGPKRIWWGGGWKKFIPITALGVILVGGAYYYPDGYVSMAQPYCEGITPDGCTLNWQMVDFEDGGGEWQCVQYCPQSGPPPAQTVALVAPPPPPPSARCELTIFAEPGLAGANAPTGEDQPRLGEAGWRNQIASIEVRAGTWDFFTDEEFAGENMRLPPGRYPQLAPDWTKRIGSFMCVQPS